MLGKALREELKRDHDNLVLATKGGIKPRSDRPRDSRREWLTQAIEDSLRYLDVDHIDLYQIHWPDPKAPADGLGPAGLRRRREDPARRCLELRRRGDGRLLPDPSGRTSGLLTGSFTPETTIEKTDWRSRSSAFTEETFRRNLAVVDRLKDFAAGKGISVGQLAIAWTFAQPGMRVAIVGARKAASIEASLAAAEVDLTAEDLTELDRLTTDAVPVSGANPEGVA